MFLLQVIETIGQENVKLSTKQVNELIDFIKVEEAMKIEMKIEKALFRSLEFKTKSSATDEESMLIDTDNDNLLNDQQKNVVRFIVYRLMLS
jgi:tetrahydromethanopterin S-methyltransferase subunit A